MQILSLDSINSTQNYLKELVKQNKVTTPLAVVAKTQTNGIGSRENSWNGMDGNLFLSFAISLNKLPKDLKLESASIYFAYILKETLAELDSKVWLKWPNDFYIDNKKIGGMITHVVKETLICGVGLNIQNSPENFEKLDIKISIDKLLNKYFESVEKNVLWKQVFSNYQIEFHKNKNFFTHKNNLKISLKDVILQSDGSIISDGERIYSLR
ncbi:biotin--[acetyl-CoA-carboxylase] ligase [Candidatus Sulfurimonas marisnigri]|uniref:Biotin--[acetyl-CoA-carboxylase] ligase n=1 Tax=Candidatus Sulfurimonas marisnigri TaxID=2740405 RepID=A0A7S7LYS0_9BACT|nr:biotin--[acetyl-CoA-carboxylase] ligase [Candidatus Sulfurimonas marisnigri]QOY53963.1 biotin--[acetyl-CoA-carboxylase] ligase [Candidatus Sulfurimonas marisnigri]